MPGEEFEITSHDGVALSVRVEGSGPPIVLVHGTAATKDSWVVLAPLLAEHHTVWSYDRRGRGASGDAAGYAFIAEIEDVAAVVHAAGRDAHLVGHSFGALCAIEAVAAGVDVRSLTVYEIPAHQHRRADAVERALALLDAGDAEAAFAIFLPEVVGLSETEVVLLRSIPEIWAQVVGSAATVRREVATLATHTWTGESYRHVDVPFLSIAGGLTESPVYVSHAEVSAAVPHAEHVTLAEQRHIAMVTDPQPLADAIVAFAASADLRGVA